MKRIFFFIFCAWSFWSAEAQNEAKPEYKPEILRVATWNIEELNLFKWHGRAYEGNTETQCQHAIEGLPQDITAGQVISQFMSENKIDLLFIQEFTPFAVCDIGFTRQGTKTIEQLNKLQDLDAQFDVTKKCYYNSGYLADKRAKGFSDYTLINSDNYQENKFIPNNGECYVCIYRIDKVKIVNSSFEPKGNPQFEVKRGDKNEVVRPPVMTEIELKNVSRKWKFSGAHIYVDNYHAALGENSLPTNFSDIKISTIDEEGKLLGKYTDKTVLFLGDMNKKKMDNAIKRENEDTAAVDYIYASPNAESFINSKVRKVDEVGGRKITSLNFYENFVKVENGVPIKKSKRFSDHNPIYTDFIFGGEIETSGFTETKRENKAREKFFPFLNIELKQIEGAPFLNDINKYKAKVEIELRSFYCPKIYTAEAKVFSQDTANKVLIWRAKNSNGLKAEEILRYFKLHTNYDFLKPGKKYNFKLKFTYNDFWYVEKDIVISVPRAEADNKSGVKLEGEIQVSSLGAESSPTKEIRSFIQKRGNHCEQNGDEIWMVGKCFIKGEDVNIKIPGVGDYTVDDKKDIDEDGNFNKLIGYATNLATGQYTANFYVKDDLVEHTEFAIVPCTPQKDPWDDPEGVSLWSKLWNALKFLVIAGALLLAGFVVAEFITVGSLSVATLLGLKNISTVVWMSAALAGGSDQMMVAEIPLSGKVMEYSAFINNTSGEGVYIIKDVNSIKISGKTSDVLKYIKKELGNTPLTFISKNEKGAFEIRTNDKVDSKAFNELFKKPVAYNVTGTGSYNPGTSGRAVGLDNSETGVMYYLSNGSANIDSLKGKATAISFGIKKAGTYNVIAMREINGCTVSMTGSAAVSVAPCPSGIFYVNAAISSGTGSGSSWENACASLSDALATAHACSMVKTIKVAAGTYKPTKKPFNNGTEMTVGDNSSPLTERDNTFHIPTGVTIEGGYNASGQRDIKANVTILSGDIGKTNDSTDNCYHVVLASTNSANKTIGITIDGFTITGGNADVLKTLLINGNKTYCYYGGGITTAQGTNILTNNRLHNNSAKNNYNGGGGGGVYNHQSTNTLTNNVLYSNSANYGGGIYTYEGTNTLTDNTLYNNWVSHTGGGICTIFGTNTLTNNALYSNWANHGGGVYNHQGTNILTNNMLYSNLANYGGGVYSQRSTNTLTNNILYNNSTTSGGGGIYTDAGTNTLTNNIFWNNKQGIHSNVEGADYFNYSTAISTFKNNLLQLASNKYPVSNSGNYAIGLDASGNIFAKDPLFVNPSNPTGPDGIHRTADDGFQLAACSPAIDAGLTSYGSPNSVPERDILGKSIYNNLKDMGAYERQTPKTIPRAFNVTGTGTYFEGANGRAVGLDGSETGVTYQLKMGATNIGTPVNGTGSDISFGEKTVGTYTIVATNTSDGCAATMTGSAVVTISEKILYVNAVVSGGTGDGSSWANAYPSLSDALVKARVNSFFKTIKVAAGTYKPTKKWFENGKERTGDDNRSYTFHIPDGVKIEGGYNAATNTRDITANITILSGDIGTTGVITDNCYHVVYADGYIGVTIDGFSITGGNVAGSYNNGAGICIHNGTTNTLTNNMVYNNNASESKGDGNGGGIYIIDAKTNILTNNTVYNNSAGLKGGGICLSQGTSKTMNILERNSVHSNTAFTGGGIYINADTSILTNNTIYNNSASQDGGGIRTHYSSSVLINNTIYNNKVFLMKDYTSPDFVGGGIYMSYCYKCTNTLTNNIFADNKIVTDNNVAKADFAGGGGVDIFKNNLLQLAKNEYSLDDTFKDNIFAKDPLFENPSNPANGGLRLKAGSPCIGTGISDGAPDKDILGNSRPKGSVTIGAYQYMP